GPMRSLCAWFSGGIIAASLLFATELRPAAAQTAKQGNSTQKGVAAQATDVDEEFARQRQIVDRFLTVLERNPRRGTALDKVYGFHIENGSIEEFVKQLHERVANKPDDGAGWMILGLVESQRGRDAAAVEALSKAKELR